MMWGQKGGRSLITGNSPGAWLLRILIFLFLAGGIILFIAANIGGAQAQQGAPVEGLGKDQIIQPATETPPVSGAIIFGEPATISPMAPVFRPDEERGGIRLVLKEQVEPHALDAGWKGKKTCTLLDDLPDLRMFRCEFAPGVGHERHFHPRHWGYVVEGGKMRVTDSKGVRELVMKAGDTWRSEGVEWHEALNIGDTSAIYLIVEPKAQP